jgi:type I restriction enzyme M protein
MQDDCYLIAAHGWKQGAQPREIVQVKNKDNKLVWPEKHDFMRGKRRFKSDLVPASILVDRYFTAERDTIAKLESEIADLDQQLDGKREDQGGEEGLLAEVVEGEGDKQKITAKAVKGRLKEIGKDPDYADESAALEEYADLLEKKDKVKAKLKNAEEGLQAKIDAKYPKLTEDDVNTLVVDDKWLVHLAASVRSELDRVSQNLTGRVRQLAERYQTPLPKLNDDLITLSKCVGDHLREMEAAWN